MKTPAVTLPMRNRPSAPRLARLGAALLVFAFVAGAHANTPPTVSIQGPAEIAELAAFSLQAQVSDPDPMQTSYTWNVIAVRGNWDGPPFPTLAGADQPTLQLTAPQIARPVLADDPDPTQNGPFTVTFEVTVTESGTDPISGELVSVNAKAAHVVKFLDTINEPPFCWAGGDQTAEAGTTLVLYGKQSYDPNGQPLTYLWEQTDGLPAALTKTDEPNASVVLPETETVAVLGFKLTVSDGALSASDTNIVTVFPHPKPPSFISEPATLATVGMPYIYDGDNTPAVIGGGEIRFYKSDGPPGFSIDFVTGVISWIPVKEGIEHLEIEARNSVGGGFQAWDVRVRPAQAPRTTKLDLAIDATRGPAPLVVRTDAAGSRAGEGDAITRFAWLWGDDTEPGSQVQSKHVYRRPGTYNLRLNAYMASGRVLTQAAPVVVLDAQGREAPPLALHVIESAPGAESDAGTSGADAGEAPEAVVSCTGCDVFTSTALYAHAGPVALDTSVSSILGPGNHDVRAVGVTAGGMAAYDGVRITHGTAAGRGILAWAEPSIGAAPLGVRLKTVWELGPITGTAFSWTWDDGEADGPEIATALATPGRHAFTVRALHEGAIVASTVVLVEVLPSGAAVPGVDAGADGGDPPGTDAGPESPDSGEGVEGNTPAEGHEGGTGPAPGNGPSAGDAGPPQDPDSGADTTANPSAAADGCNCGPAGHVPPSTSGGWATAWAALMIVWARARRRSGFLRAAQAKA